MRARLHLAAAMVVASVITFGTAMPAVAAQTFPDPFGGEGLFVDISSGAQGLDVGDAFFLRDGEVLRIRMFLDAPNSFIETHVCFSADPFTARIPPGQCPYEQSGAGSGSYDIQLPPSSFPAGTVPFTDPLGEFCVQVHVAYSAPGLALTSAGGGSAFAGWQPGSPFFGSVCFPPAPEPPPPFEATVEVTKTGAVDGLQLTFTVTVLNPTASVAENVVLVDSLPAGVAWTLPAQCALGVDEEAICNLGNIDDGISVELEFTATLPEGECGTFSNGAYAFVEGASTPTRPMQRRSRSNARPIHPPIRSSC